jgi:hypothetical protein
MRRRPMVPPCGRSVTGLFVYAVAGERRRSLPFGALRPAAEKFYSRGDALVSPGMGRKIQ